MSNTDSFVQEVTEEVRREQLYGYARRYGWIAVVVVLGIVGGAAWNEYSDARATAEAQQAGAALDAALRTADPAARATAFAALADEGGDAAILARFGQAEALVLAGDAVGASELLAALRDETTLPPVYSAMAALKWAAVPGAVPPAQERVDVLGPVIDEGSQLSLLALEQRGLAHLELGDVEAAHADFRFILGDPLVTASLRDRVTQMIIATGGTPGAAALTTAPTAPDGN